MAEAPWTILRQAWWASIVAKDRIEGPYRGRWIVFDRGKLVERKRL